MLDEISKILENERHDHAKSLAWHHIENLLFSYDMSLFYINLLQVHFDEQFDGEIESKKYHEYVNGCGPRSVHHLALDYVREFELSDIIMPHVDSDEDDEADEYYINVFMRVEFFIGRVLHPSSEEGDIIFPSEKALLTAMKEYGIKNRKTKVRKMLSEMNSQPVVFQYWNGKEAFNEDKIPPLGGPAR